MAVTLWRLGVFLATLSLPLLWLYQALNGLLGPDPGKILLERLGQGALILLLLTLCLTPLQQLRPWTGWIRVRRQLGLWTFCYAGLHLLAYLFFILGLDLSRLGEELQERPYILVGALALLLLVPLAATSNAWSQRRLGRRWKRLHRLVYLILILALLHMLWIVRSDLGEWLLYAVWGAGLLLYRLYHALQARRQRRQLQH